MNKKQRGFKAFFITALAVLAVQATPAQSFSRDSEGLYKWTGSFVLDVAGMLSAEQNEELSGYLMELNDTKGVQIAVLTVPTTDGEPVHDFAVRHFEKWQLGQKGVDNGALLTIVMDSHDLDITTGDGTEGVLTDILCKRILDDLLAPALREEKYGDGITSAVRNMAGIITKDDSLVSLPATGTTIERSAEEEDEMDLKGLLLCGLMGILFCFIVMLPARLVAMIFDGPPHSVGEFFAGFLPRRWRRSGMRAFGSGGGGNSSYRSGGGGRTSGGGASGKW